MIRMRIFWVQVQFIEIAKDAVPFSAPEIQLRQPRQNQACLIENSQMGWPWRSPPDADQYSTSNSMCVRMACSSAPARGGATPSHANRGVPTRLVRAMPIICRTPQSAVVRDAETSRQACLMRGSVAPQQAISGGGLRRMAHQLRLPFHTCV